MKAKVQNIITAIDDLPTLTGTEIDELVDAVNRKVRARQREATQQFSEGQIVEWDSRKRGRGLIRMKIERVNQKSLTGYEVDAKGARIPGLRGWKVSATLVRPSK